MRIAVLDKEKCKPGKCGYLCEKSCPGVRMGEETITHEEKEIPIISEELCTGCGICIKKCPYGAISIVNVPEELDKPVHQYGVNGFRVFKLPVPKPNSVVGIVGANGIGKSTVLKILGGQIVPNLGKEKAEWKEIIEYHRGQEIQNHLEALQAGKVTVAYKPQHVDSIPQEFKGDVSELLEQVGDVERVAKQLEIENVLGKKVGEISGGELQRVAIAATLMKDATLYCFDEPTSYLDVSQRLKVAGVIRELAKEKSVIVVEHDLAVADYLSDYTHVLYGMPAVYGIVSSLKGVRVGINEFLDGYLTTENMRFRKHGIKFEDKAPSEEWKGKEGYEFPAFTKKFGSFALEAEKGGFRKGEVVGVLGPNATGKSTFMKILAGEEKPSSGDIGWGMKIAYKPQYLKSDFDGTVQGLVLQSDIDRDVFDAYLKDSVVELYEKEVGELSGGELQRVAVSMTLAKDCDLCLLDEPSAFLDVEQRIKLAENIRRITEKTERVTVVIDHDITLADYVSDRAMFFDGEPGVNGHAHAPESLRSGMNRFLKKMGVTYRRDPDTGRPRANKPSSQKDEEQKKSGEYYYTIG